MKIATGMKVRISFELKVKGGEVIESSDKNGSLEYVHGSGKMLPALEKRLDGMAVGEEKKGTIPSGEAFPEKDLPTKQMLKKEFPATEKLDVGRQFAAKGPDGKPIEFKIVKVTGNDVMVRFLHPLSGKDLEFRVKVLGIDDPKSKRRESVAPPPPPAAALDVELEPEEVKAD